MGSHKPTSSQFRSNIFLISVMKYFLMTAALLAAASAARFCPGEGRSKNKRCVADDAQYKCGVFLENLRKNTPITWLGALPDALAKVDQRSIRRSWELTSLQTVSRTS